MLIIISSEVLICPKACYLIYLMFGGNLISIYLASIHEKYPSNEKHPISYNLGQLDKSNEKYSR